MLQHDNVISDVFANLFKYIAFYKILSTKKEKKKCWINMTKKLVLMNSDCIQHITVIS